MYQSLYNAKVKTYPDGGVKATIASKCVFKNPNDVSNRFECDAEDGECIPKIKDMTADSRTDSINRAKSKIHDIARMNTDFTWFVTLTINPERLDSKSPSEVARAFKTFLSNNVQRKGLKYLFVAEHHKKGGIHFHGLINDVLALKESGTVKTMYDRKPILLDTARRYNLTKEQCKTVYNIPAWSYGFSTAIRITDGLDYVSKYITKYITKDCEKKIFGNYYFAGGRGLEREVPYSVTLVPNPHTVKAERQAYCEFIDCYFKYLDSTYEDDRNELEALGLISSHSSA